MFELVHHGVDSLYVAFQGALDPEVIEDLRNARTVAEERQEKVLVQLGPGAVEAHLATHGAKGGYAFLLDTGPEGEGWMFKANTNAKNWNGFVKVSAGALLTRGFDDVVTYLFETLAQMGFRVADHAINRIDIAMDFTTDGFEPKPSQFVTPANTKTAPYYGAPPPNDEDIPQPVYGGGRVESVTVGKMPGRQLTVYDKRREAIQKGKRWWFDRWGVKPEDKSQEIWRLEIRAGKRELKDKWQLAHLADVRDSLGDILLETLADIRYLADFQTDSNVSRQALHPLWIKAQETIQQSDLCGRTGLLRGQVKEVERQKAIETYEKQIEGICISYAAAKGWDPKDVKETLPDTVQNLVADMTKDKDRPVEHRLLKAKEKRRFIDGRF